MQIARTDAQRLMPPRRSILPRRRAILPHYRNVASEQPASPGAIQRAHANNAAHPNQTFFTPHQSAVAGQMARHNNPLGTLGNHIENFLQLRQTAQQGAHMFDPRSRGGLANIAGLFAGGPEDISEGAASEGFAREMPGQFERYSPAKAAAGGHLGHDMFPSHIGELMNVARNHPDPQMRAMALRMVHDHFFGGEVHAKDAIPPQP